jgi:hypothetical protein
VPRPGTLTGTCRAARSAPRSEPPIDRPDPGRERSFTVPLTSPGTGRSPRLLPAVGACRPAETVPASTVYPRFLCRPGSTTVVWRDASIVSRLPVSRWVRQVGPVEGPVLGPRTNPNGPEDSDDVHVCHRRTQPQPHRWPATRRRSPRHAPLGCTLPSERRHRVLVDPGRRVRADWLTVSGRAASHPALTTAPRYQAKGAVLCLHFSLLANVRPGNGRDAAVPHDRSGSV